MYIHILYELLKFKKPYDKKKSFMMVLFFIFIFFKRRHILIVFSDNCGYFLILYGNSTSSHFFFFILFIFMAVLDLRFCARAFSSCGKRGPLFIAVRGPLTLAASLVAEHRFQMRRLSNCGSRAQLLHGMWDPPRPGLKPMSPALAGRFSTTAPPGKPMMVLFL